MSQHPPMQPITNILANLLPVVIAFAEHHEPPIDFTQEVDLAHHALQSTNEALAFRALEDLVLSAHASGLTKHPELSHEPSYCEAVQVLRMSEKPLPEDL